MSSGRWRQVTSADGLEFRPSLLNRLDEKHVVDDATMNGAFELRLSAEPAAIPYLVSSASAVAGYTNPTIGWEALREDPRFVRHETYGDRGITATVLRPAQPLPAWVRPNQRPDLVWSVPSSLHAVGRMLHGEAQVRMYGGKSSVSSDAAIDPAVPHVPFADQRRDLMGRLTPTPD
jgi:hypothetical protein